MWSFTTSGGNFSGIFNSCIFKNFTFYIFGTGYYNITVYSTFNNCSAGSVFINNSQPNTCSAILNGNISNCIAGDDSFGTNFLTLSTCTFINCYCNGNGFANGIRPTYGKYINCIATGTLQNVYTNYPTISTYGTFINCIGGDYSFGGNNNQHSTYGANVNGYYNGCIGGNYSFASSGNANGTFINCVGGNGSFGGNMLNVGIPIGNASGTFTNCVGNIGSFGGGLLQGSGPPVPKMGGGVATGKFFYCTLSGMWDTIFYGAYAEGMNIRATTPNSTAIYQLSSSGTLKDCTLVATGSGQSIGALSAANLKIYGTVTTNSSASPLITNLGGDFLIDSVVVT